MSWPKLAVLAACLLILAGAVLYNATRIDDQATTLQVAPKGSTFDRLYRDCGTTIGGKSIC